MIDILIYMYEVVLHAFVLYGFGHLLIGTGILILLLRVRNSFMLRVRNFGPFAEGQEFLSVEGQKILILFVEGQEILILFVDGQEILILSVECQEILILLLRV